MCCITLSSSREKPTQASLRQHVKFRRCCLKVAEEFLALLSGRIKSRTHPSKCRKLISCIYFFCLSFSSPPLLKNKNLQKYLPFSFAFFVRPFLSLAFCSLVCYVPSICLHLRLLKIYLYGSSST